MLPLKNARITQEYGRTNPVYRKGYHTGLDLVADDKQVRNSGVGVILRARFKAGSGGADPKGWGNYVIIRQADGKDILYAHLAKVTVTAGEAISAGDTIGVMGSTGHSTGEHLHFEVWDGNWQNRNDINAAGYLGIANQLGPVAEADPFAAAVQLLQDRGIIASPDYWLVNAQIGQLCKGEYVRGLLINMDKYLRGV